MKTLLLLTDFSIGGNHAAEYGYSLAKYLKANVVLCNAIVIPLQMAEAGVIGWPLNGYDGLVEDTERELQKLKKHFEHTDHSSGFHPQIDCINQMGRLQDVVQNIIPVFEVTMIVMGTHHNGSASFLLDNNAKNMISYTKHPLLLVPLHAAFTGVHKIAFATDFEQPLQDISDLEQLIPIAALLGSEILITHVHNSPKNNMDHQDFGNELVQGMFNKTNFDRIVYQSIQNDNPNAGIRVFCEDQNVDLLVMVHRAHNFMDILLKGSHTQKMAKVLIVPLLVLPNNGAAV